MEDIVLFIQRLYLRKTEGESAESFLDVIPNRFLGVDGRD